MKTCIKCGKLKPEVEFYKGRKMCKNCYAIKNKEAYEEKKVNVENDGSAGYIPSEKINENELNELIQNLKLEIESKVDSSIDELIELIQKRNNELILSKNKIIILEEKNEEMEKEIDLLNEQMGQVFEYMNQMSEYVKQMIPVKSPIRFDIPEEKPVLGSAKKKGFNTVEEIVFQKNRLNKMNAKELRELAEQLRIKTSKSTGGYKTVVELQNEIGKKLDSWMNTE
jgi:hypothetical protein